MSRHEELIERAQANDSEAMELLVSENAGLIWQRLRLLICWENPESYSFQIS